MKLETPKGSKRKIFMLKASLLRILQYVLSVNVQKSRQFFLFSHVVSPPLSFRRDDVCRLQDHFSHTYLRSRSDNPDKEEQHTWGSVTELISVITGMQKYHAGDRLYEFTEWPLEAHNWRQVEGAGKRLPQKLLLKHFEHTQQQTCGRFLSAPAGKCRLNSCKEPDERFCKTFLGK